MIGELALLLSFTFTPHQQAEITALHDAGPALPNQPGNQAPMYQYIAQVLVAGSPPPIADPVVERSWLWFVGAARANAGQGSFSTLIREYTQAQGLLHFGRRFRLGVGPEGVQEASNEVARRVYADLSGTLGWSVPAVDRIAAADATGVGATLFARLTNDTALENNAAWSGAALFSRLGDDQTWRWVHDESGPGAVVDTFDDLRNLLFARISYDYGVGSALEGASQAFRDGDVAGQLPDLGILWQTCWLAGGSGCLPAFERQVRGQTAEAGYALPGMSMPLNRTVALLESAWRGQVVLPQPIGFGDRAHRLFAGIGIRGQNAPAQSLPPADLLAQALATGTSALEARQALAGLTPFVVSGGGSASPDPGLLQVSAEWLQDRAEMLDLRLAFDAADRPYDVSLIGGLALRLRPLEMRDLGSGLTLRQVGILPPPAQSVQFGTAGNDMLVGSSLGDRLHGGAGGDQLIGGGGADLLAGGPGNDTYQVTGSGSTIYDSDGLGSVQFNGATLTGGVRLGDDLWRSGDGRFRYLRVRRDAGYDILVQDGQAGDTLTLRELSAGQLGIDLADAGNPIPPHDTVAPDDTTVNGRRDSYPTGSPLADLIRSGAQFDMIFAGAGNDVVYAGPGADRVFGGPGADSLYGEEDNDYLRAGPDVSADPAVVAADTDMVAGGPGNDLLSGGVGDDVLYAGSPGDDIDQTGGNGQGDWLQGGLGEDQLFGSSEQDFLHGGAGADVIFAGAGDDVVLGDGDHDFSLTGVTLTYDNSHPGQAARHEWDSASSTWFSRFSGSLPPGDFVAVTLTPANHFLWTLGRSGDDFTFNPVVVRPASQLVRVAAGGGNDLLFGGPGNDWIAGQTGNDVLYGGLGDDTLFGDDLLPLPVGSLPGNDRLHGGAGDDRLFGNAGDDELYGDAGDDLLVGDDPGGVGVDLLFGGEGADTLRGGGGNDYLDGGPGNDPELNGGDGNDIVHGGSGNDILWGDGPGASAPGDDILFGDEGDDLLYGDAGDDMLDGGDGFDILEGGDGNDLLVASAGGDVLRGGAGNDRYRFVGFSAVVSDGIETRIEDAQGTNRVVFGPLVFPGMVSLTVEGPDLQMRYLGVFGARIAGGANGTVIHEYEFADGRVFSHGDLMAGGGPANASSGRFTHVTAPSTGNDYLVGTPGADALDGLAGDDVILGEGGNDTLSGSEGDDLIDGGEGDDHLLGGAGQDRLYGGPGNDLLDGGLDDDRLFGGDGDDELRGGDGDDSLHGGEGDDVLLGGSGADQLRGGPGVDVLEGGPGVDEYLFVDGDDLALGSTILDSGSNAVRFDFGIVPGDVFLSIEPDGSTLRMNYRDSSVLIPNGVGGQVIDTFRFAGPISLSYAQMINYDHLFASGFD